MADPILTGQRAKAGSFKKLSQRSTPYSNDANNSVRLEDDGFLHKDFLRFKENRLTFQDIDGTTTPKAVSLFNDGRVLMNRAGYFRGFTKGDSLAASIPVFLNSTRTNFAAGVTTASFTANAGTDRVLLVWKWNDNSQAPATGCTWNGFTLTLIEQLSFGSLGDELQLWAVAIGTSVSNQTGTLAFTGGGTGGASLRICNAAVYTGVDQTTPITDPANVVSASSTGSSVATAPIPQSNSYGLFVGGAAGYNTASINTAGFTQRSSTDGICFGDIIGTLGTPVSISATRTGSNIGAIGAYLNGSSTGVSIEIITEGIVDGFTGLTTDAKYYVSDDAGAVTTTGTGAYVGTAVSSTAIRLEAHNQSYENKARAYYTGAQIAVTTSPVVVNFDTKNYDFSNEYTASNGRFTAKRAGFYQVNAKLGGATGSGSSTVRSNTIAIYKNGAVFSACSQANPANSGYPFHVNISDMVYLDAGDYVDIRFYSNTASSMYAQAGSENSNFSIFRVA